MIRVIVVGAAGRMGRRLVANIVEADDLTLTGAIEAAGIPFVGQDAGAVAGVGECGVKITDDLNAAVKNADAIIDFSTGGTISNATAAVDAGCAVVIGTTALGDAEKAELKALAGRGGRIVFAPNMSVGVNLLFHLCREVTKVLGEDYDIEIVEMHHNQKKDSPSGTAVRLAEVICAARELSYTENVVHGREGMVGARTKSEIGMHAVRGGDVVGDHTVIFATGGERVELTHKASSRDTFAKGALRAVRFLASSPAGLYDMQDVLKLK
ncbi:MAG: 4-hydroxy-tetrahydrodipicolinate reductase [Victivallaceae bacterium]